MERTYLQIAVALAGIVPFGAGLGGVVYGPQFFDLPNEPSAWSHFHYLSGLLLGIGLIFWASISDIERHRQRFNIMALVVFIGGLSRLAGAVAIGDTPGKGMWFALAMELIITPALWAWQRSIAERAGL